MGKGLLRLLRGLRLLQIVSLGRVMRHLVVWLNLGVGLRHGRRALAGARGVVLCLCFGERVQ